MNETQLLQALKDIGSIQHPRDDGWMTAVEIGEMTQKSTRQVSSMIHALHKAGRLEVGRMSLPTIAGHYYPKTVYRLKEAKP